MKRAARPSAQHQLAKIRRLLRASRLPLLQMTDEQVIEALRKTREELWEAKVALRPR